MAIPAGDVKRAPYVGPLAFKTEDEWRFFGRDHEVDDLRDLLLAERIVLFYSPSGAGKTSLVQAALLPRLKEDGFRVLPVMRVNLEPSSTTNGQVPNRYINSVLLYLEEGLPLDERTPPDELAKLSLVSYLDQHRPPAGEYGPAPELLVFDQFEEILGRSDRSRDEGRVLCTGRGRPDRSSSLGAVLHARGLSGWPGSVPSLFPDAACHHRTP